MPPLKSWRSIVGITVHQRICINIYWDRVQSFCITSAFSDIFTLLQHSGFSQCHYDLNALLLRINFLQSVWSQLYQIVWHNLERVSKFFLLFFCISLNLWCKTNIIRKLDVVCCKPTVKQMFPSWQKRQLVTCLGNILLAHWTTTQDWFFVSALFKCLLLNTL